jgi:hypothetical protein
MHFALCKEQHSSRKQDFFRDFGVAEATPGFKPAGLTICIFFPSFSSFCLLIWNFRVLYSAVSKLSPGVLS